MNGLQVNSCGLGECLDRVEEASQWKKRKGKLGAGRGLGMACSHYVSGAAKPVHWTGEPHATAPCGWVFGLGVRPGARLRGTGTRLLEAMCAAFRRRRVTTVRTLLARDNALVLAFFRSQGMMAAPFIALEREL
jgi:GNAT superfamily N-acetyltransferase